MLWEFTPQQLKKTKKLVECLEKVCHCSGSTRHTQITAVCWGLAYTYQAVFDANITPVTDPAVTSTPETGLEATPSPKTCPKAEPGKQTVPVPFAPITKLKKWFSQIVENTEKLMLRLGMEKTRSGQQRNRRMKMSQKQQ